MRLDLVEANTDYSSRVISDGTLRVLGLLAMLAPGGPSTTIGFEEPENGVHPRRLQIVARLLDNAAHGHGKQLIVTTHSSRLPDYVERAKLYARRLQRACPDRRKPERSGANQVREDRTTT